MKIRWLKEKRNELKKNPTKAELWAKDRLRKAKINVSFQKVFDRSIFDFFCFEKGIAIEIDGSSHDPVKDELRDNHHFEMHTIKTLRIPNFDDERMNEIINLIRLSDTWDDRKKSARNKKDLHARTNNS